MFSFKAEESLCQRGTWKSASGFSTLQIFSRICTRKGLKIALIGALMGGLMVRAGVGNYRSKSGLKMGLTLAKTTSWSEYGVVFLKPFRVVSQPFAWNFPIWVSAT